jgi:hypothetical protein
MELLLDSSELLQTISNARAFTACTYLGVVTRLHAGGVLDVRRDVTWQARMRRTRPLYCFACSARWHRIMHSLGHLWCRPFLGPHAIHIACCCLVLSPAKSQSQIHPAEPRQLAAIFSYEGIIPVYRRCRQQNRKLLLVPSLPNSKKKGLDDRRMLLSIVVLELHRGRNALVIRLDAEVEPATDDCLQLESSVYRVPVHFHSTIRYQLALCCGGMLPDQHVGLNPPHTRRYRTADLPSFWCQRESHVFLCDIGL